jgi:hypothetical protein
MEVGDWIAASFAALWTIVAISLAAAAVIRATKANRSAQRSSEANTRATATAEQANQRTQTQAATNGHGWEIVTEGHQGNWFLRNGSTEDTFDVTVTDDDLHMTLIPGRHQDVVHPQGGFILIGGHDADTPHPMITVTWHRSPDRSDPARQWSHPLPTG